MSEKSEESYQRLQIAVFNFQNNVKIVHILERKLIYRKETKDLGSSYEPFS